MVYGAAFYEHQQMENVRKQNFIWKYVNLGISFKNFVLIVQIEGTGKKLMHKSLIESLFVEYVTQIKQRNSVAQRKNCQ